MKLTTEGVARLKLPAGKSDKIFWDDALPAFGLRIQGARKSWVVQYRAKGAATQRRLSFATAEQLSLPDARKEAGRLLAEVRLGHDPAGDKRKRIEAAREARDAPSPITLGEAAKRFLARAETRLRPKSLRELRRYLLVHWAPLHKAGLTKLTRADV
ncbi:MAG: DUF4102 domain-containing protein, partial [Hyphomicrobiales bacterium]|nr:DUF4102 domain-containing protein [Hyphomicrobiales bacterium]